MLVHPNPMIKVKTGHWHDRHMNKVVIQISFVKSKIAPKRYTVFERDHRGVLCHVSGHITEEQAVVMAQRIANRLFKKFELTIKRKALKHKNHYRNKNM